MAEKGNRDFTVTLLSGNGPERSRLAGPLRDLGYDLVEAAKAGECLEMIGLQAPDVLIADVDRIDDDRIDFLKSCKKASPATAVILVSEHMALDEVMHLARTGAFQCLGKPVEKEKILDVVDRALDGARQKREAREVRVISVGYRQSDRFMVGKSTLMQEIVEVIEKVAASKASTVLIQGESGTGKELVARAIHFQGLDSGGQFMEINCATLPENLLESELFGHRKGAFTDAQKDKQGLVELAEGGTLFLDEIGEMPMNLQSKVLRLIETKRFRRIGGVEDIEVNTRVIAATNRDLKTAISEGRFRDDLYFRLMVIPIYVPALRERKEDIPLLASLFIDYFNKELARSVRGVSREALGIMMGYDWPGNVRELRNTIERAILLESIDVILPEHLPRELLEAGGGPILDSSRRDQVPISLKEAERRAIIQALRWAGGNKSKAARVLGITRQTLRQKIKTLGVDNILPTG
jgi:DNA-binding NtrC family response regulator